VAPPSADAAAPATSPGVPAKLVPERSAGILFEARLRASVHLVRVPRSERTGQVRSRPAVQDLGGPAGRVALVTGIPGSTDSTRQQMAYNVTFRTPGTYVLRALAHNGATFTYENVTFNVVP